MVKTYKKLRKLLEILFIIFLYILYPHFLLLNCTKINNYKAIYILRILQKKKTRTINFIITAKRIVIAEIVQVKLNRLFFS